MTGPATEFHQPRRYGYSGHIRRGQPPQPDDPRESDFNFGYDSAGNRASLAHPNGTTVVYGFLNNNWLSSISHRAPNGTTFQSFTYTYDANGNRLTQADPSGTTTFVYDALDRLIQAAYPGGYGTYSWTMDAVGNRLTQTGPGGPTNYTYDANNRLIQAGSATYPYDANGNVTNISSGRTFTWDVFNRMTSTTASGTTVTYTYNGDGLNFDASVPMVPPTTTTMASVTSGRLIVQEP